MARFILVRVIQSLIVLVLFSMAIFGVVRLTGDPALAFLPADGTEEDYQRLREWLGLDKPIYVQYYLFISGAVKGDFGKSIHMRRPVIDSIKEMLPNSLRLIIAGMFVGFILAIPLGVMAAAKKGRPIDTFARVTAGLGQSIPNFWLALLMVYLFVVVFRGFLPTAGMGDWRNYVMPVTCLAFFTMPGPIRLIRSSMLEVLDSEYIKLARIKGISERVVVWKHALRNSLIPVLTLSAVYIATSITGAVTTEVVFAWPGMGRLAYTAIMTNDYPVIQGVTLVTAVLVVGGNFLADITYAYVDPRIRLVKR